jgi:nucleoid-associated protein YgaU
MDMEDYIKHWLKKLKENEQVISMLMGGLVVLVIGFLLVTYFRSTPEPVVQETQEATESASYTLALSEDESGEIVPEGLPSSHRVVKGEYLWTIAEKYYGSGFNWVDIAEANQLTNNDVIEEDQQLTIPQVRVRVPVNGQLLVAVEDNVKMTTDSPTNDAYVVKKGDSLWSIAQNQLGDGFKWSAIYEINKELVSNPSIIETGWELQLPR